VFSSLPADVAGETETGFARAGFAVVSNSSAHRLDESVPLLIPEVNAEHLALLDGREAGRGKCGYIVTNPNCSTVMLALALAPLVARFGVEAVVATTLQALSGAGYPGVASLDITDNVIPYIASEEEKIERETRKILGSLNGGRVEPAGFAVSAQCHRVNVVDGHLAAVRVKLSRQARPAELREAFAEFAAAPPQPRRTAWSRITFRVVAVGVTEVTTALRREMLLLWRDDSVPPDHADAPPGEGLGQGRQARRPSPAPRRMVPGGPYLLESHRRARREPAQRAGRPALPRDPLSSPGAVEHRAVRAARDSARGPHLPADVR